MKLRTVRSHAARSVAGSLALVLAQLAFAQPALAQYEVQTGEDLTALGDRELRDALDLRYEGALAATLDPAIVNATDARFHWASEAKVQCAIAQGFMKNDLRDEDSIRKCSAASARAGAPADLRPVDQHGVLRFRFAQRAAHGGDYGAFPAFEHADMRMDRLRRGGPHRPRGSRKL